MHLPWRFRGRLIMGAVVVVALAAGAAAYASIATRGTHVTASVTPATAVHAGMKSGQVTGHRVTGQTYAKAPAPTAAQLKAVMSASKEETAPAPNRVTTNAGPTGPAVAAPNSPRAADSDYKRFLFRALPVSSIVGGSGYSSFTNEPSVAKAGKDIFMTGNWYAGYSHNHTGSWTFLNPFTIFGSGFCCDQVTIYDKTHDRVYWLLQYGNHLTVANSSSNNLASWCSYNFYSTTIGQASTTALDFNDVMVGTRNLYFTTNIFPTSGGYGSEIVRLPLEQMSTCSSVGFNYYSQLDSFTWRLVQGSDDRAYWGSDWDPTGARPNGSSFRVFWWDENSGTIHWNNYNISPFAFYTRNTGQYCGSQDGVVKNWCQYADSRVLGAYRANGLIGFSMNAKQGGGFPFPYTVRYYFRESNLAYLSRTNLWASWGALQFLSMAPNSRGHVGGTYSWGGGTSTTHYYPGTATLTEDDVTPNQPWTNDFALYGGGNTCTYGGLYRWGDYLTTRPNDTADTTWIGTGFRIYGGNCGAAGAYTQPVLLIWGRSRDTGDYNRWTNK